MHYKQMCGMVMVFLVLSLTSNALVGQKLLIIHANSALLQVCSWPSGLCTECPMPYQFR